MTMTPPTLEDLVGFTGLAEETYDDVEEYVDEVLQQAVDALRLATGLSAWPDNPGEDDGLRYRVARYAVMELGEAFLNSRPYRSAAVSPFQSETIGSYSYSKVSAAVRAGVPTGLVWFDQARDLFAGDGADAIVSVSTHVFETGTFKVLDEDGDTQLLGPADVEVSRDPWG